MIVFDPRVDFFERLGLAPFRSAIMDPLMRSLNILFDQSRVNAKLTSSSKPAITISDLSNVTTLRTAFAILDNLKIKAADLFDKPATGKTTREAIASLLGEATDLAAQKIHAGESIENTYELKSLNDFPFCIDQMDLGALNALALLDDATYYFVHGDVNNALLCFAHSLGGLTATQMLADESNISMMHLFREVPLSIRRTIGKLRGGSSTKKKATSNNVKLDELTQKALETASRIGNLSDATRLVERSLTNSGLHGTLPSGKTSIKNAIRRVLVVNPLLLAKFAKKPNLK
jgi:hypothetical protein